MRCSATLKRRPALQMVHQDAAMAEGALQGAAQVARSAMQHLERRKMTQAAKDGVLEGIPLPTSYAPPLDGLRPGYRRRGLPIGSGVTDMAAMQDEYSRSVSSVRACVGATKRAR